VRKDKDAAALQKLADELGCRDRITPVIMEVRRIGLSPWARCTSLLRPCVCGFVQVTDEQSVADAEQVVHKCLDEQGLKLMAIINNAGIAGRGQQLRRHVLVSFLAKVADLYALMCSTAPVELVSPKNVQHMINVLTHVACCVCVCVCGVCV
jgi:NAD(P)-dependent dehydrogenase (short-subunit alcohol dehydrogenase family)